MDDKTSDKVVKEKLPPSTPLTQENKPKAKRPQLLKKKGPRTKGVLFKRLPNGSIVNADLSDEELAKRAERKMWRNQASRSDEIDSRAGIDSEKIHEEKSVKEKNSSHMSRQKIEEKGIIEIDKTSKQSATEKEATETITDKSDQQSKEFVPSPGPAVSAWSAGKYHSLLSFSLGLCNCSLVVFVNYSYLIWL